MTAFIFVQVFLLIWIAKFSNKHEAKNIVRTVNDSVQCPAKNTEIIPVGADGSRIIGTVAIVPIYRIEILDIFGLSTDPVNYFTVPLASDMAFYRHAVTKTDGTVRDKTNLFLVTPSGSLNIVCGTRRCLDFECSLSEPATPDGIPGTI